MKHLLKQTKQNFLDELDIATTYINLISHKLRGHKIKRLYRYVPPQYRSHFILTILKRFSLHFPDYALKRINEVDDGHFYVGKMCINCNKKFIRFDI